MSVLGEVHMARNRGGIQQTASEALSPTAHKKLNLPNKHVSELGGDPGKLDLEMATVLAVTSTAAVGETLSWSAPLSCAWIPSPHKWFHNKRMWL